MQVANRGTKARPGEPMVPLNGSGFGIRLTTLLQISILIFGAGGAFFQLEVIKDDVKEARQDIRDIKQELNAGTVERKVLAETLRAITENVHSLGKRAP